MQNKHLIKVDIHNTGCQLSRNANELPQHKKGYLKLRANIKISGETQSFQGMGRPPTHSVVIKNWEGYLSCRDASRGVRVPSPIPNPRAQGSSTRKKSPHNFWLQKAAGIIAE